MLFEQYVRLYVRSSFSHYPPLVRPAFPSTLPTAGTLDPLRGTLTWSACQRCRPPRSEYKRLLGMKIVPRSAAYRCGGACLAVSSLVHVVCRVCWVPPRSWSRERACHRASSVVRSETTCRGAVHKTKLFRAPSASICILWHVAADVFTKCTYTLCPTSLVHVCGSLELWVSEKVDIECGEFVAFLVFVDVWRKGHRLQSTRTTAQTIGAVSFAV